MQENYYFYKEGANNLSILAKNLLKETGWVLGD